MEFTPIDNRKDSSFYQEEMEIRFCQCDASHRLKISELFRIMTNLADMAFEFRGLDHQFLMEKRMAFLITRVSVKIHRMPLQIEKIRAATWEQSIDRAQFIRNFAVWSETGELLAEASSGWVLVDPVLRSILRPAQFDEAFRIFAPSAGKPLRRSGLCPPAAEGNRGGSRVLPAPPDRLLGH